MAGVVTKEEAEALRVVYPQMYKQVQVELIDRASKATKQIPYAKRVQASMFLGKPVDPTMTQSFVRNMSSSHAEMSKLAGENKQHGFSNRAHSVNDRETLSQRLTENA
jgi:hypothetical protein